jgi:ribose transport system substrate-binding protein
MARASSATAFAAALGAAAVFAVGCGSDDGGGGDSASGTAGEKEAITIGFSQRRIAGSDWYKTIVRGVEEEAERQGVKVEVVDANGDTVRQISDINTLLSRGVKGIIINPNDPKGVEPAVNAATKAKAPVVAVNSNLDPSLADSTYCYVAEDQEATGALAGKAIAEKVAAKFGPGDTIKMVTVGGYPGDIVSDLRDNGFHEGWDEYFAENPGKEPKVDQLPRKYGEWLPDKALPQMRDVATAHPDIDVVYSESDVMHAGIKQALTQAGLYDKVMVASYDGGMNFIKEMVDNPDGPAQANASNQPYDQGVAAVKQLLAAINGTPKEESCPDGTSYVETIAVTPETAKQYYNADQSYVQSYGNE